MKRCTRGLCDFEFDRGTLARTAAENRLLTMEIAFSLCHSPLQAIIADSPVLKTLP